jgi:hypothetical protein
LILARDFQGVSLWSLGLLGFGAVVRKNNMVGSTAEAEHNGWEERGGEREMEREMERERE